MPDPLFFNVPTVSSRVIGRDQELRVMWQHLLNGRRFQAVFGMDGIGKSTLASEFCDCARRSGRFSCIQWLQGERSLSEQLKTFFEGMRGRRERDVLLVIDDVADPDAAWQCIPKHENLYVVMTTSKPNVALCERYQAVPLAALPASTSAQMHSAVLDAEGSIYRDVYAAVGYVPLLMGFAQKLFELGVPADEVMEVVRQRLGPDGTLSISQVLQGLLLRAFAHVGGSQAHRLQQQASILACFHLGDLSFALVDKVAANDEAQLSSGIVDLDLDAQLSKRLSDMGLLTSKWDSDSCSMHRTVAATLRGPLCPDHKAACEAAASLLLTMWPRRRRGTSTEDCMHLVWHTCAIQSAFTETKTPLTADMLQCLEKAARHCAEVEGRELTTAASMWMTVLSSLESQNPQPHVDIARLGRDCGRLLHYLRDPKAGSILQLALHASDAVYGQTSCESALIMSLLAPYLSDSVESHERLQAAESSILSKLASTDDIMSKEELRMLKESLAVLLMRRAQILTRDVYGGAKGTELLDGAWSDLERLRGELIRDMEASKAESFKRKS